MFARLANLIRCHTSRRVYPGAPPRAARCRPILHVVCIAVLALLPVACQQDMADQPSYKPLDPSTFFADGQSARDPVLGTVARGHLRLDAPLFFGRQHSGARVWAEPVSMVGTAPPLGGLSALVQHELQMAARQNDYVTEFPIPVDKHVIEQGMNRYMIYCVVCHDPIGNGRGMVVQRGYTQPPSYHIDRLRKAPVGHLFDVITNGYGSMPMYRQQIPPLDRWAIVAYIRALQLSQHFPRNEMTPEMKKAYEEARSKPKTDSESRQARPAEGGAGE